MRYGQLMSGGALVLALTTGAWATGNVGGMVQHVDPASSTVHFTTGEIVHVEPDMVVLVNGRRVALDQVRPGTSIVIQRGDAGRVGVTQPPVLVQPQSAPPVVARPQAAPPVVVQPQAAPPVAGYAPGDASGIVAHVDRQTGVITFEDGRAFRLRPGHIGQIQPGMRVLVREAQPVVVEGTREHRVGRVQSIDPNAGQMVLHDGTVVHLSPQTRFQAGEQTVTVTDLRPGDEVVVFVGSSPAGGVNVHHGAALPREVAGIPARPGPTSIWAENVRIYRGTQAP